MDDDDEALASRRLQSVNNGRTLHFDEGLSTTTWCPGWYVHERRRKDSEPGLLGKANTGSLPRGYSEQAQTL